MDNETRRRWWVGLVVVAGLTLGVPRADAGAVVGDCDGDRTVTVDEVVTGVRVALGQDALGACPPFDADGDGAVSIDELVVGVNNALRGFVPVPQAVVTATDFQTGSFATITVDEPRSVTPASPGRPLGADPIVRPHGGWVYIVNRFGSDTVQRLDPAAGFASEWQCSTGSGTNPNDIAFASAQKAYVPRFASKSLLVVNPSPRPDCSDFVLGTIDLSPYADADGIPDMAQAAVVGGRAYVTLERLSNFVASGPGAVVVIDVATDQVLDVIELTAGNPTAQTKGVAVVGNALVLSEVGVFGVNDGGIERVDLATATPTGFLITEAAIGGDVTDFVLVSAELGYALVSGPDFKTALVAFDPAAGVRTRTLLSGGNFSDVELNTRGELYLADRSLSRPGVRVFRAGDGVELTTTPIATGLPPFDIAFVE